MVQVQESVMGGGDRCALYGCDNDRRYPNRQIKQPHVGVLRFYSPRTKKETAAWEKQLHRTYFKVTKSTKVCSNHFAAGYRCDTCWKPTLYMKGYPESNNNKKRPPPKTRANIAKNGKRKQNTKPHTDPPAKKQARESVPVEETWSESASASRNSDSSTSVAEGDSTIPTDNELYINDQDQDKGSQTIDVSELKRTLFIEQATCEANCYRYTGLSRQKLNLVFQFIQEKAKAMRYWKGSVDTVVSSKRKARGVDRKLPLWDEFVLTLVRTRKNFDVHFLADTFGISSGQVSRIYTTWITFLSTEMSFLVPWPHRDEIMKSMPVRFKKYPNLRIIIDCLELFIQKPKLPSSQKVTWSNYKHRNTVKLLVGITPNGIISFVPPLWTGMVSDKEIVKATGLVNNLQKGDAVMADKGFLIRDLLTFKKVQLISPAFCRGPRLSARGTTYTRRVAALRSHVERYILKLKQFRILSGVIPLLLKPVLDRIIFLCAALSNLQTKAIQ